MGRKVEGTCHLCGRHGPLSFEHIPPRRAFNDKRVLVLPFDQAIRLGPGEIPRGGRSQQRGLGGYTLCPKCNNDTGSWYGSRFIDWCYQSMAILARSGGEPSLLYLNYVFPLAILKQIVSMFISINGSGFGSKNPELVRFVLNREKKYLPGEYRFFVFYNLSSRSRTSGVSGLLRGLGTSSVTSVTMSELTYPPFGYVMTLASPPPDERLYEITHFSRYGYNELKVMALKPPVLGSFSPLPGDYRTRDEVMRHLDDGD